jgi:hypothetical protein
VLWLRLLVFTHQSGLFNELLNQWKGDVRACLAPYKRSICRPMHTRNWSRYEAGFERRKLIERARP